MDPSHPSQSDDSREFLQRRVARFGLYGSCLGWFFLVFRAIMGGIQDEYDSLVHPSMLYHLLAATSLLSLWLLCRSGARRTRYMRVVEVTGMLAACTFYSLMASYLPYYQNPHYIVILALLLGLVTRAIYVPSTAKLTIFVTAVAGIPMLTVTYLLYADFPVDAWIDVSPDFEYITAPQLANSQTVFAGAWWLCAIAICGGASHVIYGLRREVRDARKLGQYTLVEKLGEGGMGSVYRARHRMLRRPTALKLLPASKAGETALARFEKEVQHTAMLTHPNTVTIFDYGRTPDGIFYYAMELLDGATLMDVVEVDGPQPPARVAHILGQVAGALTEAHQAGLIHRDIKPANIMLVNQGGKADVAKVLDFGLVRELSTDGDAGVTHADSVTGTPQYLAPEAISNPTDVDERIDIYALGAVGYYLATGEHVFVGKTVVEICAAHLHDEPVAPSVRLGAPVPADLEDLILRCLAKEPKDRPQSAAEILAALESCAGLGTWSDSSARLWWATHKAAIEARRARDSQQSSGLTMEVDLARREQSS